MARDYLGKTLTTISAEQDGMSANITKISSMEGDVDVSQRKGKVITLFDVKLEMEWKGTLRHICWNLGRSWPLVQGRQKTAKMSKGPLPFRRSLTTQRKMSTSYVPFCSLHANPRRASLTCLASR